MEDRDELEKVVADRKCTIEQESLKPTIHQATMLHATQ